MQHDLSELVMSRARDSRFRAFFSWTTPPDPSAHAPPFPARIAPGAPPLLRPVSARARADAAALASPAASPPAPGRARPNASASRAVPIGRRAPRYCARLALV